MTQRHARKMHVASSARSNLRAFDADEKVIKGNGTKFATSAGKGRYERKFEEGREGLEGGSVTTEPSPNSSGSHVPLSLFPRCESSGKRSEQKECPRIFLQRGTGERWGARERSEK